MRPKFKAPKQIDTWAEVSGEYFNEGTATIDTDDDCVYLCGFEVAGRGDLMNHMTDAEIREMEERLYDEVCMMAAEFHEEYGEWLYEQRRDG